MFSVLSLALLQTAVFGQDIPTIPNCGLDPVDPACLVRNAQYTVVGTITGLEGKETSPSRYNATMRIRFQIKLTLGNANALILGI
jgi:hypothetical protein